MRRRLGKRIVRGRSRGPERHFGVLKAAIEQQMLPRSAMRACQDGIAQWADALARALG